MGHYYACHTKIKLKSTASETAKQLLHAIDDGELPDDLLPLFLNVAGNSSYFENWKTRVLTDNEEGMSFTSFASCKTVYPELWLGLLNKFIDVLDVKDGDILFQYIYEDSSQAKAIAYSSEKKCFTLVDGVKYDHPITGGDHPYNDVDCQEPIAPPMTLEGVKEYNDKKKRY